MLTIRVKLTLKMLPNTNPIRQDEPFQSMFRDGQEIETVQGYSNQFVAYGQSVMKILFIYTISIKFSYNRLNETFTFNTGVYNKKHRAYHSWQLVFRNHMKSGGFHVKT